jgi:hypothetical protein
MPIRSLAVAPALLLAASVAAQQPPIQITANLTDAPRKLFHVDFAL